MGAPRRPKSKIKSNDSKGKGSGSSNKYGKKPDAIKSLNRAYAKADFSKYANKIGNQISPKITGNKSPQMPSIPRTGPGSGGYGGVRSLYSRLTGSLRSHGK